mmetsp:Transcript_21507/g.38612  ORF Transcript_21507/g.38612 Transcript_21507/m.38612 type:complete len:193 (-) Transcript_21507:169-747(-)
MILQNFFIPSPWWGSYCVQRHLVERLPWIPSLSGLHSNVPGQVCIGVGLVGEGVVRPCDPCSALEHNQQLKKCLASLGHPKHNFHFSALSDLVAVAQTSQKETRQLRLEQHVQGIAMAGVTKRAERYKILVVVLAQSDLPRVTHSLRSMLANGHSVQFCISSLAKAHHICGYTRKEKGLGLLALRLGGPRLM